MPEEPARSEISEAVVVWTGKRDHAWPHRDDDRVVAAFGEERALELLPLVHALCDDFYDTDAHLTSRDLGEMRERATTDFRRRHPEMSDDAIDALAWCYTFDFK